MSRTQQLLKGAFIGALAILLSSLVYATGTRLSKADQHSATAYTDQANTFSGEVSLGAGARFSSNFTPSVDGQYGYNGTNFLFREGGTNKTLSSGGGSVPIASTTVGATRTDATYLPCDGSIVSQSTYPDLYAKLGPTPAFTPDFRTVLSRGVTDVAYGNGIYVAVGNTGSNAGNIWVSYDLQNWNAANTSGYPLSVASAAPSIVFFSAINKFVLVAPSSSGTAVATSSDGYNWATSWTSWNNTTTNPVTTIAASPTKVILAGSSFSDNSNEYILTTTDTVTYTRVSVGNFTKTFTAAYYSPDIGGGLYFLGASDGSIFTSPDAVTWTSRTSNIASQINQFAASDSLIVAVGAAGVISSSTSGTSWTARTQQTGSALLGVAYSPTAAIPWLATGTNVFMTSTDGTTWVTMFGAYAGRFNFGYSSTDSKYFTAGASGYVSSSTDNVTWTGATATEFVNARNATAYGNSTYVIAGAGGKIDSSSNATTWTNRTANAGANALNAAVYVGGSVNLFVVGGAANAMVTSPEGTTWTARTSNFGGNACNAIAFKTGTDLIVAVGSGGRICTSTDGVTWTQRTSNTTQALTGVAWNGTVWCAVGQSGIVLTSSDGTTWTYQSPTGLGAFTIANPLITSDGTLFYSANWSTSTPQYVYQSSDGITWTPYVSPVQIQGIQYLNSQILVYSAAGDVAVSTNGKTWTVPNNRRSVITSFQKIHWMNSKYVIALLEVAASINPAGVFTSSDGYTIQGLYGGAGNGLTYSSSQSKFVAVGNHGSIMYSTTGGVTWTQATTVQSTTSSGVSLSDVVYSASLNLFCAVGGGAIYTSPDAITWTNREFTTAVMGQAPGGSLSHVIWSATDSLFIAFGSQGIMATSPDGTTWTNRSSGSNTNLQAMAYNSVLDLYVVTGSNGQISTSSNGTTWATTHVSMFGNTTGIVSLGAYGFLAITSSGGTYFSADGFTWTPTGGPATTNTSSNLSTMLYSAVDGGAFYALPIANNLQFGGFGFTKDGRSFKNIQFGAGGTFTFSGMEYDSANDVYVLIGADTGTSTATGTWVLRCVRSYNKATQFALPTAIDTWIKATN